MHLRGLRRSHLRFTCFSAVSFDPIIAALVMALVTIVISFGIAYVLKKIPFFGKYFV